MLRHAASRTPIVSASQRHETCNSFRQSLRKPSKRKVQKRSPDLDSTFTVHLQAATARNAREAPSAAAAISCRNSQLQLKEVRVKRLPAISAASLLRFFPEAWGRSPPVISGARAHRKPHGGPRDCSKLSGGCASRFRSPPSPMLAPNAHNQGVWRNICIKILENIKI